MHPRSSHSPAQHGCCAKTTSKSGLHGRLFRRTGDRADSSSRSNLTPRTARCVWRPTATPCSARPRSQLAGDQRNSAFTRVEFKNLSAGGYTLRAQVLSNIGVRSQATQEIMVDGDGTGVWRLVSNYSRIPNPQNRRVGSWSLEIGITLVRLVDRRRPLRDLLFRHRAARR